MLGKAQPTTSKLNLVNSEVSDTTAVSDAHDGIKMADLVESLDTRELDIGEGEEIDDGNDLGVFVFACGLSALNNTISLSFLSRTRSYLK